MIVSLNWVSVLEILGQGYCVDNCNSVCASQLISIILACSNIIFQQIPLIRNFVSAHVLINIFFLQSDPPIGQMSYGDQSANSPQMSHAQNIPEVSSDAGYYSTSPSQQLVFPSPSPGLQNTSPNTPTSLPEIILTGARFKLDF